MSPSLLESKQYLSSTIVRINENNNDDNAVDKSMTSTDTLIEKTNTKTSSNNAADDTANNNVESEERVVNIINDEKIKKMKIIDTSYTNLSPRVNQRMFNYTQELFRSLTDGGYYKKSGDQPYTWQDFQPGSRKKIAITDGELRQCLRNKKIFMFGNSFHREIFWHYLRRLKRNPEVTFHEQMVGSRGQYIYNGSDCINPPILKKNRRLKLLLPGNDTNIPKDLCLVTYHGCNVDTLAGISEEECGLPGNYRYYNEEFNITIHYQFKTYVRAEAVDEVIIHDIQKEHWDMVYYSTCEWGHSPRGYKNFNRDRVELADEFHKLLFPKYKGLMITSNYPSYSRSCAGVKESVEKSNEGVVLFDKTPVLKAATRARLNIGHGHSGAGVSFNCIKY